MREKDARVSVYFRTCDTAKREQKAAGVLGRSVKCLNKRAIILTRSGISGVFQPFESIASSHLLCCFVYLGSSVSLPFLADLPSSLFFSFLGPPPKMSSAWDPRKKHKTCISFVARVESLVPLYVPPIFRPVTLSGSLSFSLFCSLVESPWLSLSRDEVAFATRICYDFQLIGKTSVLNCYSSIVLCAGIDYSLRKFYYRNIDFVTLIIFTNIVYYVTITWLRSTHFFVNAICVLIR